MWQIQVIVLQEKIYSDMSNFERQEYNYGEDDI